MRSGYLYFIGLNLLWAAVIFVLCVMPQEDIPDPGFQIPYMDKIVHFGMYFIASLLMAYPLERYCRWNLREIGVLAVTFACLFGGMIEIVQARFFARSGDWYDLLADVVGGVAGCLAYPVVKRLFLQSKHRSK